VWLRYLHCPHRARTGGGKYPDPSTAATLTPARLRAVLRKSGRQRNIDTWADRLRGIFTAEYLHQLPLVEAAMGRQTQALVLQLDAACRAADDLVTPPAKRSPSTPMPTSSPASPVSARSPAPGCSARSATTVPGSATRGA